MIHTSPATIRADATHPQRFAALEALDVLDTAPEEGFDDAVQIAPPTQRGFGSSLIERGLAGTIGGEVILAYSVEGVTCDLTASLAEIEADD